MSPRIFSPTSSARRCLACWPRTSPRVGFSQQSKIQNLKSKMDWRRGWDSNPRGLSPCRFSRPEPSTARPPLRGFETRENCAIGAELSKVDRALRRSILSIARGAADPPYRSTAVYVHVNLHDAGASTKDEKEVCPDRRGSAATLSGDSRPKRFLEPR